MKQLLDTSICSWDDQEHMLTKESTEHFKNLLSRQLDELFKEAKGNSGGTTNSTGSSPDPADRASMEADSVLAFSIKERDSRLVRKIKEGLAKLEDGTFGICEECGGDISEARLKARPIATLCIRCKEKQEYWEKLRGL